MLGLPTLDAATLLVVEDDPLVAAVLEHTLEREGYIVRTADTAAQMARALETTLPEVVLLDLHLPDLEGIDVIGAVRQLNPHVPIVVLTGNQDVSMVVGCIKAGAFDYLIKPVDPTALFTTVRNAVDKGRADLHISRLERMAHRTAPDGFIGASDPMLELYHEIDRIGPSEIWVLILGESGTGKELAARAIHAASPRQNGPFIAINCAAVPASLQESELFGHERGAFTGASARRLGRFEQATGGTLFLDEIAELSPTLQAQLLRVVQEQRFYRVGGQQEVRTDVRLLSATHADLRGSVGSGTFRNDLYYRLAVYTLRVPPLRDRGGTDIDLLARGFMRDLAASGRIPAGVALGDEALAYLQSYEWPGNVRELRNAIERAAVLSHGVIEARDLPVEILSETVIPDYQRTVPDLTGFRLSELERLAIGQALHRSDGHVGNAAERLGMPRATLYRKLKKIGIDSNH